MERMVDIMKYNNRKEFIQWIRDVINTQATPNGNSVCLDDFSKDEMTEYSYPKEFTVNGDRYYWNVSTAHTKSRHFTTHYELWFTGTAFKGSKKIATGEITLSKVRKGLKEIFDFYNETIDSWKDRLTL